MAEQVTIVKANGKHETFDAEKLRFSLLNSGASDDMAEKVIGHILPELKNGMTTSDIYKHAAGILEKLHRPAARSYSLRRAIMALGPSGFPFEDFVAEILKAKGFECETGQILLGGCVSHEVDVVAYNEKKLLVVEAKFHNELGTKSDLKVVLYVKARFDDLRDNVYDYGGNDRKITDAWLVTNTKFSSTAIRYGECQHMTLIGWNYPERGNLQDLIEEKVLHPITCLSSLSQAQKQELIGKSVVLCSTIRKNPKVLSETFGPSFDPSPIISEINELYHK
ncbi:MAG: restriction endonuclease [Patescibacteria group bacterium]